MEAASSKQADHQRIYSRSIATNNTNDVEPLLNTASVSTPRSGEMSNGVLLGLSVAGVALAMLATVFGMFHVDVFLRCYELPLPTYSVGNFFYSAINIANDLAGAWLIDHAATTISRSEMVGLSGCIFSLCFLTPFFRWQGPSFLDGPHFVVSTSLYDTLYSFTAILIGSVVTDNHQMSDKTRVQFMASGKVCNLIASFMVARIGLHLFDTKLLFRFRLFLLLLAFITALLFVIAQDMISGWNGKENYGSLGMRIFRILYPRSPHLHDDSDANVGLVNPSTNSSGYNNTTSPPPPKRGRLQWKQVAYDFWCHKNFRIWIGMEMILEAQATFALFFLKTFMDRLVLDNGEEALESAGVSKTTCDFVLSMVRPLAQVAAIFSYIPIRQVGYPQVYRMLFLFNFGFSIFILSVVDINSADSSYWILMYICLYPVISKGVQSSGFHLAHADMVLEMKRNHALEGRFDEPSFAGLFLGANGLLCKPARAILPMTAATVLHIYNDSKAAYFYLLVIPPIICSCLQLLVWRHFDLTPLRTSRLRDELRKFRSVADLTAINTIA